MGAGTGVAADLRTRPTWVRSIVVALRRPATATRWVVRSWRTGERVDLAIAPEVRGRSYGCGRNERRGRSYGHVGHYRLRRLDGHDWWRNNDFRHFHRCNFRNYDSGHFDGDRCGHFWLGNDGHRSGSLFDGCGFLGLGATAQVLDL